MCRGRGWRSDYGERRADRGLSSFAESHRHAGRDTHRDGDDQRHHRLDFEPRLEPRRHLTLRTAPEQSDEWRRHKRPRSGGRDDGGTVRGAISILRTSRVEEDADHSIADERFDFALWFTTKTPLPLHAVETDSVASEPDR